MALIEEPYSKPATYDALREADGPVTSAELAAALEIEQRNASTALRKLWRDGYLERRRRPLENGGQDPFEYRIRFPGEVVPDA